ncbi:hypothetical protein GUJ93_ZPchr0009g2312 [Zizania palustris]|uniref:Uncharacterized protein n=1 Tax=Zizania palustris TaxID=103762 RepID=A0A8J5R189_ZIZPA|nr:hypothetical protein GUJ93_ZPchr0009g2312 [Zizania palustris]
MKEFMGKLSTRLSVDEKDNPTIEACTNILQTRVCQSRYLLKKNYFIGVPANEVRTTSPVSSLTDEQWLELMEKWSSAKGKEVSEKNKCNRGKSMMENMLVQPIEGLDTTISSTEIVSKVLSQTSVASTFLKNAGLETPGTKSTASSEREAQLREKLQAEKQRVDLLQQELNTL